MNDLPKGSNELSEVMFADDTNLFLSHKNLDLLFTNMNNELYKISTWFKSNKLSLNVNKTKWSLFHPSSKKRLLPQTLPQLFIDDVTVKRENVTKFLGVLIDENISWKYHIDTIGTKISKSIGILYKAREFLSKHNLKQLYYSFIHSYLNYANIAWGSTHKSKLELLYRRQKQAARIIYFKDRYTNAKPLLRDMGVLNIYELNIFNILCFMYKCKYNLNPPMFQDLYKIKQENKYTLRDSGCLFEPLCRTEFSKFSINYRGPFLWNKIAQGKFYFPDLPSFLPFKYRLKEEVCSIENLLTYF